MKPKSSKSRTVEPGLKEVVSTAKIKQADTPHTEAARQKGSAPDQSALEIALEEGWKMEGVDD